MSEPFTHRVLPYDGVDDYLAGALPFLRDGVDAGDRVLAVTSLGSELLLREELGPAADGVEFAESSRWYVHPSRTLADCLGDADSAAWQGRRLRVLGEPSWAGRSPLEVLEWQRVEALVNVAFTGTGAAIMCAYSRTQPAGVLAAARHTHPETVKGLSVAANPGYQDPWAYNARCDGEPLPDPPPGAETLTIERPDLHWLRVYVADYARQVRLPDGDLQRLLVAVTEVVTNASRHGQPPLVLTMWADPADRSLVCQVTDQGRWTPGADPGLIPPRPGGPGRFGLWAVRLLCPIVQVRPGGSPGAGAAGTTVRMRFLPPPFPPGTAPPVNTA